MSKKVVLKFAIMAGLSSILLQGCSSGKSKEVSAYRSSQSQNLAFEKGPSAEVDLISMIDPENRAARLPGNNCIKPTRKMKSAQQQAWSVRELNCAMEAFETYYMTWPEYEAYVSLAGANGKGADEHYTKAVNSLALAIRRNKIQDRIINRSDSLCSDFQRRLGLNLQIDSNNDEGKWFGMTQERLVKSVGGLVTSGDAVWALTRATRLGKADVSAFDEDVIEKSVLRIATEGISLSRQKQKNDINKSRFFVRGADDDLTSPDLSDVYTSRSAAPMRQNTRRQVVPKNYTRKHSNLDVDFVALSDFQNYDSIDLDANDLELVSDPDTIMQTPLTRDQGQLQNKVGIMSIAAYSLEQALGESVSYHNSCSIRNGLNFSSAALVEMQKMMAKK